MFHNCRDVIRAPVQVHNKQSKDNVDSIYKCNTCDEEGWTSETEAALHAKTFHKKEINALVKNSSNKNPLCLVCLTKQPDVTALISHWKTLHLYSSPTAIRVEREIFICDNCGQVFFNKLFLQVHINHRKHIQFTKVVCPLCHKQVKRKCLSNHLFSHRALRISSCPICLHKCDNRSLLLKHINNTHRKHLLCDLCGFATTKVEFFNAHVNKYEERKCSMSEDGCSVEYEKYFLRSRLKTVWRNPVARYCVRGLILYNDINICIMCRQICVNEKEMKDHIKWDHRTYEMVEVPKPSLHNCVCGEVFDNTVLLKQHMFKTKHNIAGAKMQEHPVPNPEPTEVTHTTST